MALLTPTAHYGRNSDKTKYLRFNDLPRSPQIFAKFGRALDELGRQPARPRDRYRATSRRVSRARHRHASISTAGVLVDANFNSFTDGRRTRIGVAAPARRARCTEGW
jgi:hypothetical protein